MLGLRGLSMGHYITHIVKCYQMSLDKVNLAMVSILFFHRLLYILGQCSKTNVFFLVPERFLASN